MKSLILCVDRDDDLGRKARIQTPIVGRRRTLDAAIALGVADPEDSDTNALLAAVKLYDKELQRGDRQVEVAVLAGHASVGIRSDRALAEQLEEVLALTQPDDVILVSDGAEDEQILPIIQSRTKVSHVHRSIVKQAPRLEGFYHVLTRMLDDERLAKKFVLPVGLIFIVWGLAFVLALEHVAWALTFGIAGLWLFVHAMRWERTIGRFFGDMAQGVRAGKVALVADVVMIILLVVGAAQAYELLPDGEMTQTLRVLFFVQEFLLYFISALLIRTAGQLFDGWVREGRASLGHWTLAFSLIAFGFVASAAVDVSIAYLQAQPWSTILTFDLVVRLVAGVAVAMGGIIIGKYIRTFLAETPARR